ncbi:DUF2785 domain-containing protein [Nocardioides dubius]|uniref:DUF2785 domain-containing protein n=1 Tax=Nocardioides dubius TaxID=317019 RepID=A0ABN1TJF7_9ACTN
MASAFWDQVKASGLEVPADRPLKELTAELTAMLGSSDPGRRDHTAFEVLAAWTARGVYDDLLSGLGDGMAAGLDQGLGERHTDTVFRRTFSARMLAVCLERDNAQHLLAGAQVLTWGDHLASWLLREQDLRAHVPTRGWANALGYGADALGALADSPHFGLPELTVLLDVLAERLLLPGDGAVLNGEPDRLAAAAMRIVQRDLVPAAVLEGWVARIALGSRPEAHSPSDPYGRALLPQAFLRSLYLRLTLSRRRPSTRADLLLALVDGLRSSNPDLDAPTSRTP